MAGLLQHHHDRSHLDEGPEVDRLLLVPRRHAAVLLHLRPEPLHDVALLVQMAVDRAGLLAAAVRLHHDFSPAPADRFGPGVTIVARVGDHRGRLVVRQAAWLLDRFPEGKLADVPGLVKLVSRAEIEAADWSLMPGRYVGVAPAEVDEDFDFEQTLRDLHVELADLNQEAVELAAKIQRNLEELGI